MTVFSNETLLYYYSRVSVTANFKESRVSVYQMSFLGRSRCSFRKTSKKRQSNKINRRSHFNRSLLDNDP